MRPTGEENQLPDISANRLVTALAPGDVIDAVNQVPPDSPKNEDGLQQQQLSIQ